LTSFNNKIMDDLHKGAPVRNYGYSRENRKLYTEAERILSHTFGLQLIHEGSHHPSGWSKVPLLQERDLG
jgi:hypothetical protein